MALPPDREAPIVLPWSAMASAGSNREPLLEKSVTRAISYGGGMRVPRLSQDKVQVRVGLGVPSTDQGRLWRGPLTPLQLSLGAQRMQLFRGGCRHSERGHFGEGEAVVDRGLGMGGQLRGQARRGVWGH